MKKDWSGIWLVLGIFAALNLMDYGTFPGGDPFRDGKLRYLFFTCGPLAYVYFKRHLGVAPAFFVGMSIISYTIHNFMLYAATPLLMILAVMAGATALVKMGRERVASLLVWSGTLQAGFALVQLIFGYHMLYIPDEPKFMHIPVGLYGHETVLGPFLLACLCAALWRRDWVRSGLMVAALLASLSSMTIGCLGVVVLIYVWHVAGGRVAAALLALGAVLLAGFFMVDPSHPLLDWDGRGVIWKYGWMAFLERPMFGYGPGAWYGELLRKYSVEYAAELRTMPRQLHCDSLDFLVEYGLFGAAFMALPMLRYVWRFRPTWTHAASAAILVNGLANFPLCLPSIAVVFVACWAFSNQGGTMESYMR